MEYNIDDDMFVGNESSKEKKSRSQKSKNRYKHARQKIMAGDLTFNVGQTPGSGSGNFEFEKEDTTTAGRTKWIMVPLVDSKTL